MVAALADVVVRTPAILSRRVDPRAGLSLVWGRIVAGSANAVLQQLAPILPCRIRGDPADARNAAATAAIQFGLRPRRPPGAGGVSFDYP